ncbi:MAG TPA: hypothetical protein VK448_05635 [Dissulfurispiraceae bacterium]|nr:hypothetical protein [Dissulfurispiraceae bacterium]
MKKALVIIITLLFSFMSTLSFAYDTDKDEAMILDTLVGRPLGVVALVTGTAVFVVGLPFSLLGHNTRDTAQNLVVNPAKFTFVRPVGDMGPDSNEY